jgi:hypothetical protein
MAAPDLGFTKAAKDVQTRVLQASQRQRTKRLSLFFCKKERLRFPTCPSAPAP